MSKPPAIIVGNGVTALGALRSLAQAGIPTYCLDPKPGVESLSRYYQKLDFTGPTLLEALQNIKLTEAVLFSCNDAASLILSELPAELSKKFIVPQGNRASYQTLIDKQAFSKLLLKNSVPHPLSIQISSKTDFSKYQKEIEQKSLFLKPVDSQKFFALFKEKAWLLSSISELKKKHKHAQENNLELILQEYIPGDASCHFYLEGFFDSKGQSSQYFSRQRKRMYPAWFGNSTFMVSRQTKDLGNAQQSIETILKQLDFHGIFSAEFKQDARDGLFKIIEVNARPWWYVEVPTRAGINIMEITYLASIGKKIPKNLSYDSGLKICYPYYDFYACREKWKRNELKLSEWIADWSTSSYVIFSWKDPAPALRSLSTLFRNKISQLLGA